VTQIGFPTSEMGRIIDQEPSNSIQAVYCRQIFAMQLIQLNFCAFSFKHSASKHECIFHRF
jgi:hypothetical protein